MVMQMPNGEMPLKDLYSYQGVNPKPEDFDAFWNDSLHEIDGYGLSFELKKSRFQVPNAECFDLYFSSMNNARIHAKYVKPSSAGAEKHPIVLQFHGYTANAGSWANLLKWAACGFSVLAMDVRGQGGESQDNSCNLGTTYCGHIIRGLDGGPKNLFYRNVFLDTVVLARIAMSLPEVDVNRLFTFGASQGGALSVVCGALVPQIRKVVTLYPFLADYKRILQIDYNGKAYSELIYYFRQFDPSHSNEIQIFTKLGYIDIQFLASRIQGDVLFGCGLADTNCPPSSQFAVYNKISSSKQLLIYPDFSHEEIAPFGDQVIEFFLN
jgi:cephalosporin-C deacetylase